MISEETVASLRATEGKIPEQNIFIQQTEKNESLVWPKGQLTLLGRVGHFSDPGRNRQSKQTVTKTLLSRRVFVNA